MLRNQLEPGDMISFTQKDGLQLVIIVYTNGISIKADNIKSILKIERHSSFTITATAVEDKE